jgi:hypothetical protein
MKHFLLLSKPLFSHDGLFIGTSLWTGNFKNGLEQGIWSNYETEWLYTGHPMSNSYPADLGYIMGYKIVDAYCNTFEDINEVIDQLLDDTDYYRILHKSQYGEKFETK